MRIRERFNPRAPCGARRTRFSFGRCIQIFQPTRPLRGATLLHQPHEGRRDISTHAPLAGRDNRTPKERASWKNFNPRAPCGARLSHLAPVSLERKISTHAPLAGRDVSAHQRRHIAFISTHAPLAGRDDAPDDADPQGIKISTHAPLAGRDARFARCCAGTAISTHAPLAGRDLGAGSLLDLAKISTHAPLAGRDAVLAVVSGKPMEF